MGPQPIAVFCNGASPARSSANESEQTTVHLDYRHGVDVTHRVKLSLPGFSGSVYHLEPRLLDLLEIAAYIFSADRLSTRGNKDAVEYHSWSRDFRFHIRVRDYDFWQQSKVGTALSEALRFMTGDRAFSFTFYPGHDTPPENLFDAAGINLLPDHRVTITLFSGGVDSLAGALQRLNESDDQLYLVSHRSGNPASARTQNQLAAALDTRYPGRVQHYKFGCSLTGKRAPEETQRSRAILYTSIAYALAAAMSTTELYMYENGVTALNLVKRGDLLNARASRTTHPQTIARLETFYSLVAGKPVTIHTPFRLATKTDVMKLLAAHEGGKDFLTSSVSCGKTFSKYGMATHCGGCSQCIDRRLAANAAGLGDTDHAGLYSTDFICKEVADGETRSSVVDYLRQVFAFADTDVDKFFYDRSDELAEILDWMIEDEVDAVTKIWDMCHRHGEQVIAALNAIRKLHDDVRLKPPPGSLLEIINSREYLKPAVERLVAAVRDRLSVAIPIMFKKNQPADEADFNAKVRGVLEGERGRFEQEHPTVRFALAQARPDFSEEEADLYIESKYIRGSTSPSKVTAGIAEDITKYGSSIHTLFVVYDPHREIEDDKAFSSDFESRGNCTVFVLR